MHHGGFLLLYAIPPLFAAHTNRIVALPEMTGEGANGWMREKRDKGKIPP
jgi:hypothetical protein